MTESKFTSQISDLESLERHVSVEARKQFVAKLEVAGEVHKASAALLSRIVHEAHSYGMSPEEIAEHAQAPLEQVESWIENGE